MTGKWTRLQAVVVRELRWLLTNRVAFCTLVGVPLIALTILTWTFSRPVIHNLNVALVDADRSRTSMVFAQTIDASSTVDVSRRYQDLSAAVSAIRGGEVIAAVHIPARFEQEMTSGRRPQIVILYNNQYLSPGSTAARGLQSALNSAVASANEFVLTEFFLGTGAPLYTAGPVIVSESVLGNTSSNYAEFLMRAAGPTVLHISIAIVATFSMASEFRRRRGLAELLETAGNSPLVALLGKSLPLLVTGFIMMTVLIAVQNMVYGLTIKGSLTLILVSQVVVLAAYIGVGMALALLLKDMASSLSLAGIFVSPAFGYAGIGMPVFAMNGFAQGWSSILPLRWHLHVFFDQATRGIPVQASMRPFLILLGLAVLYNALAWSVMAALARRKTPAVAKPEIPAADWCKPTVTSVMLTEIRRIVSDRGIFGFFITGALIYGVFYPQPYLSELVRRVPIAVVDHDGSATSQGLIQALDASDAIEVRARFSSLAEAHQALNEGKVFGVVDIPSDLGRNVMRGSVSFLPVYADGTYFSIHGRTLGGVIGAVVAEDADRLAFRGREDSSLIRFGMARLSPVEVLSEPLYNPTGGYGAYAIPAAFVLIVQQLLLLGAAGLGPLYPSYRHGARPIQGAVIGVTGQMLAHAVMMVPATLFLLVVMIRFYGFSTLGSLTDLALMTLPLLLATSLLAQALGYWFRDSSTPVVLFIAVGLPLFFLVGAAWPLESIPPTLQFIARLIPSSVAIDGIVRISQMGATLHGVMHDWLVLWLLAALYFVLAVVPRGLLGKPGLQERDA